MKLPAVAIAAAFAGGILLGLSHLFSTRAGEARTNLIIATVCAVLLIAGLVLAWRDFVWCSGVTSLLCWLALGILAACLAQRPLAPEHILSRVAMQQVELRTPLRWHGLLRNEPTRLPWGYGLDVELTGVEQASGYLPVRGGMRLGFIPHENDARLPEVHAGDEVAVFAEGRLPLVYRDPGAFNRREFLAQQDIHLLATVRASALLEGVGMARPTWQTRVAQVRERLRTQLDAMFADSPASAAVLRAMLLGDRSFVDRVESVDFQKTGTFHVLVVAGLHVGALAFFLRWVTRKLRVTPVAGTMVILAALFAYVMVVEQRAPVLRAGLMVGIVTMGALFHRRLELLNSAAIAALVLMVAKPTFLVDSGFLLSFLAIGCIAGVGMPFLRRHLQPMVRALEDWRDVTRDARHKPELVQFRMDVRDALYGLTTGLKGSYARWAQECGAEAARVSFRGAELFVLSVVLQLGMLPMMAREFHRVSLLGPVVNVFAVPLTGLIVPLGFVTLATGMVVDRVGRLLEHPLTWLVELQGKIVTLFAAIPHGSYRIPGPKWWVMALFFVGALGIVAVLRAERKLRRWEWAAPGMLLAAMAVVIASYPFGPVVHAGKLEMTVLDVAQGDSIVVVSPKGSTLLIDGGGAFLGFGGREEHLGPDPGEEAVSAYLWSRGFQRLDTVMLTHAHQDHVGGLTAVLENFRVERLWLGRETGAPAFERLKRVAARGRVPIEKERRGTSFVWDGVQVDFLWPEANDGEMATEARNNDSLVVRLHYGERTILLPGDAEKQVEYAMLAENQAEFLHADVLKVGHHGSKNSTMPEFLAVVRPEVAIISSGIENPYGHPSPELLARLGEGGSRVLRTDTVGEVTVLTDGRAIEVSCYERCGETASKRTEPTD